MNSDFRGGFEASLVLTAALLAMACKGAASEPAPAAESAAKSARTEPAGEAPAQPSQRDVLLGSWCQQTVAITAGKPVPDGSTWNFFAGGKYSYAGKTAQIGEWTLSEGRLDVTDIGNFELAELSAQRMLLRQGTVEYTFARECGPELAQARKVEELRSAAAGGQIDRIRELLVEGVDVNAVDRLDNLERTALFAAVENRQLKTAILLIERGADVTALDAGNRSMFQAAARNEQPEMTRLLELQLPSTTGPAFGPLADGRCARAHVKLDDVCVHILAVGRPNMYDDLAAYKKGGAAPLLEAAAAEQPVAATAAADAPDALNPFDLDPAALVAPVSARRSSRHTAPSSRTSGSDLKRKVCAERLAILQSGRLPERYKAMDHTDQAKVLRMLKVLYDGECR